VLGTGSFVTDQQASRFHTEFMISNHENRLPSLGRCCVAVLALLLLNSSACGPQKEGRKEVPSRDINEVMNSHVVELMSIPGVVGVAVGELDDKTPCILILVVEKSDEINRKVPKKLEGHPVRIFVSGEIRPMRGE
jgi:hypothetical protein